VSERLPPDAVRRLLAAGAEPDELPVRIGDRYRVVRELGRGGMGVVYEAEDVHLSRRVALKMIAESRAPEEVRRRFEREALAVARLDHPNVAAIFDATSEYIAMQLVAGGPLSDVPRTEVRRIVTLVRDAALAVHHAHERGIVHRDLKPSNLLVEGDRVFVVDFGLAKESSASLTLPGSGTPIGTPAFMAPEQVRGASAEIDGRTDVYGLGATLYSCLTGRPPFGDADLARLLRSVAEVDPPRAGVDRDLDVVIEKCLAKEPGRRYRSARELALDLDRWLRSEPIVARPPSPLDRLRLFASRRRSLLRVAGLAALVAVVATGMVLVPIALRQSAARAAANQAMELAADVSSLLSDVANVRREGRMGEANDRLDAGIRACEEFLGRHPVARVHVLLAQLLVARGRRDAALAALDRALVIDAALPGARFERGLLRADRDPAGARADLAAEIESPKLRRIDRVFGRAEIARIDGDLREARRLLEDVLAVDPSHLPATLSLLRVALAENLCDEAFAHALSAVSLQRGSPRAAGPR